MSKILIIVGSLVIIYLIFLAFIYVLAGKQKTKQWLRFVPDCIVMVSRLVKEPRVKRRYKIMFFALLAYLAVPIDIVPDFIPIAGQLDDAVLIALVFKLFLRSTDQKIIQQHWPGPKSSLEVIFKLTR